ncbi:MAG: methyl-accepting chemotaxis protein [Bryobacteraceae bacterium]
MARRNTENSRDAAELVTRAQQKFGETNQSLKLMEAAMGEIRNSSDKISKIIKTIDEIAFQTNILASNAAVEAARAGEAGMGFAVVADEVRNLAQRCAQAAKDTATLIEEAIGNSQRGQETVEEVSNSIHVVTEEAAQVKVHVDAVNSGSQEQARGIEQIGKAIAEMEQVTQKSAASAEECASAAEELNVQSRALQNIVGHLSAMVGGGTSAQSAIAPAAPRRLYRHVIMNPSPGYRLCARQSRRKPDQSSSRQCPWAESRIRAASRWTTTSKSSDRTRHHSQRRATAGSTAVARRAGM